MIWAIVGGALLYTSGCYYFVYRNLSKDGGAGPGGLAWLIFPFSPLIPFILVGMAIAYPFKKLWQAIKG